MDVPSNPALPGQGTRLHGNRTEEKAEEPSWFAMEAAIPSEIHRAQGACPFPVRFTEIYLPHGTIVSGPTGHLTASGGKYRIVYPDSFGSESGWIVIFRDNNMPSQDSTSRPGATKNSASTQPEQDALQQYTGNRTYATSSENNIFVHEAAVAYTPPAHDSHSSYHLEDGNKGFFDEAIVAITASMASDVMSPIPADMVEAMDMDSTPDQNDGSGFQNHEYACQKFRDIFSAAIVPETDPQELRQAALDSEQLRNCFEFHAVNPTWPKLRSFSDSRVHPQTLHPQDSAGTQVMGHFDKIQNLGFLTIRLPTIYRVYPTDGALTSFDVPFYDGTEQAGGGVYSFYLPTSPPVNYELPCLQPGVMARFNLSKDHGICRDGRFIPDTLVKGSHEIMLMDGDIEIVDCRDSSCLWKDACGQGEAPTPQDTHDSGTDSDNNTDSDDSDGRNHQDIDDQSPENAGDKSPEQMPSDASNESGKTTDGEWGYLPKHMRPPQHRRAVMVAARELLRPHRDWLYNEAKKEKKAEEEVAKDTTEEAEKERKRTQKEELRRESELYRQAAYREKTRQKHERNRWAQTKREADKRELAAMMQQETASGTQTRRPQRRTARAAVDYREKVAVQSSSSDEDSSGSREGSEEEEA